MEIKVTVKSASKAAKALDKVIADKADFKQAVKSGNVSEYLKKSGRKFATPISGK